MTNKFTLTWTIENFSMRYGLKENLMQSPEFKVDDQNSPPSNTNVLKLSSTQNEHVSCELRSVNDAYFIGATVDCILKLCDPEGEVLVVKEVSYKKFFENVYTYQWKDIIKTEQLNKEIKYWSEDKLTVCCQMVRRSYSARSSSSGDYVPLTSCEVKTKIGFDRYHFQCFLDNRLRKDITLADKSIIEISVTRTVDSFSITMKKKNKGGSVYTSCEISLVNFKTIRNHSKKDSHLFTDQYLDWKFPTFITKDQLSDQREFFALGNHFSLVFDFQISNSSQWLEYLIYSHNAPDTTHIRKTDKSLTIKSLKSDLKSMFSENKHADITLKVGDITLLAHKAVLTARSSMFAAMFDQDMVKSDKLVIDISDIEADTLKPFLEFLYTGNLRLESYEMASKLLLTSNKYQVPSLKSECSDYLDSILNDENACDIMSLAECIDEKALKASALHYITTNAPSILSSPKWSDWIGNNSKLATEIFSKLTTQFSSDNEKDFVFSSSFKY